MCGPIGTPLHKVSESLKSILEDDYAYNVSIIKLSKYIRGYKRNIRSDTTFNKIQDLITGGNDLREQYGNNVLSELAINEITVTRETRDINSSSESKEPKQVKYSPARVCHIIDSIKNKEELNILKSVYGDMVFCIGVYSSKATREAELKGRNIDDPDISVLIDRDSGEEIMNGQSVRETFPSSDYFLHVEDKSSKSINNKLKRFLHIIFHTDIVTPSHHEKSMQLAATAALNSACLSRQVGACITDQNGEVLAIGWNDVPKYGGDLYQYLPGKSGQGHKDCRCHHIGQESCHNDVEKIKIKKSVSDKIFETINSKLSLNESTHTEIKKLIYKVIDESPVDNLIEFSRSIHAEMHALIMCGHSAGAKLKGAKLYTTTYPCHLCAKHIIAAGIHKVYFIEPYPKSMAMNLHEDALTEDPEKGNEKVVIAPFDGVAPNRFLELFRMKPKSRKNSDGKKIRYKTKEALPKKEITLESVPALEGLVANSIKGKGLSDLMKNVLR